MKLENKGFIAASKANPKIAFAVVLLILSLIGVLGAYVIVSKKVNANQRNLEQLAELRVQSYRLTLLARDATSGDEKAFNDLAVVVKSMDAAWASLRTAESNAGSDLKKKFANFNTIWSSVKENVQAISSNKELIVNLNSIGRYLNDNLPNLQKENNNVVSILLDARAPSDQVSEAQMQAWRAERIGRNVDKMLRGDTDANAAATQFNSDANLYNRALQGMKDGDAGIRVTRISDANARASLEKMIKIFSNVNKSVKEMYEGSSTLFLARQASDALLTSTPQLLNALAKVQDDIAGQASTRTINNKYILVLLAIALGSIGFIGITLFLGTRERLGDTASKNERNQAAILRLLDELADLADGDLTTTATVTEDFTGAIADSINFTIDQLRILVARINETAVNVSAAAQSTQQTALHLAEASEHQAQEISGASAAVNEMAVTIDQVSANASESATVAERAVSIAGNGAKVVQNTIHGMDTIREQIQDTSKRIKRLGESSQEIGDIVSLINDIADQTNILALNAAIQASMAGDAGRGFAVVADEVQRLAERSAAATKQIEALVKTIQNDTNEAVISMEQTTSEVVRGARLAQDAGVALGEIENVSSSLAELIQNISNAARQQASSAGHISNTMNVIQEITTQTSAGTSETAESIGNLAEMALDLRKSVAGFKLPEGGVAQKPSVGTANPKSGV